MIKAQEHIKRDGGVKSFNFDFTEWTNKVGKLVTNKKVLKNWFLLNSTHVVDLAFYLGGVPKNMTSYGAVLLVLHIVEYSCQCKTIEKWLILI